MARVIARAEELADWVGGSFVPTMGALHAGHAALVRRARELADDAAPRPPVVVSVFVNPTQFGPGEDFARYPRPFERDVAMAQDAGADVVFAPPVEVIYPPREEIIAPPLPEVATAPRLEEAHRPTHFAGVCQVVARLFDLVRPRFAIFGEKDYQQLLVIEAMTREQSPRWGALEIVRHQTEREPGGLAMSSRNVYLSELERARALAIIEALRLAREAASPGRAASRIEEQMRAHLVRRGLEVDYAAVRDARTLIPIDSIDRPARALVAARVSGTRLIDNLAISE